ncbi:MAG TPA: hypothetical protein VET85_04775 [Stellaceae bacterium]|nr:hypothetical protein [Stellaceae bacterium]
MRRISIKALIVSNIAHWLLIAVGMLAGLAFAYAGMTIATEGAANFEAIFDRLKSSVGFIVAISAAPMLASIAAGYVAARIAKKNVLLNGALASAAWIVFSLYETIWGAPAGDDDIRVPLWLDDASSYSAPLFAMLGAALWQRRARRQVESQEGEAAAPDAAPELAASPAAPVSPARAKRFVGTGSGLGIFAYLVMRILLPKPARDWVLVIAMALVVILIAFAVGATALKKRGAPMGR